MTEEDLLKYLPTVNELLECQGNKDESLFMNVHNIKFKRVYDEYNNELCRILVDIPTDSFAKLGGSSTVNKKEELIKRAFNDTISGEDYIGEVLLRPKSNVQSTLFEPGEYQGWKNGYYRMFISHLSTKKLEASNLKSALEDYGITSFVAHEDIKPTSEWIKEIEKALGSMHCMAAMMYQGFHHSNWCDQEIGVALGRNITVIPLIAESDPYGFIGEYQGIKIKGMLRKELAEKFFEVLCDNEKTRKKYLNCLSGLFLSAQNRTDADKWLKLLSSTKNLDNSVWADIQSHVIENDVIMSDVDIVKHINEIFKLNGLKKVSKPINAISAMDDLPF